MSLFGSLYTAVSGLNAQATAFGNISDNVANSQTVGFKGVNTSFQDYLTTSTATSNEPGAVSTTPEYTNTVQGTVTSSTDPLAMAISGQGFFAVQEASGESTAGTPNFSTQDYYTRTGDFTMTKDGYLVNSAGEYLQGWAVTTSTTNGVTTSSTDQSQLVPIQINQNEYAPIATNNITLSANLPASQGTGSYSGTTSDASQINIYDAQGTAHTVSVTWTPDTSGNANTWTATLSDANGTIGSATVSFDTSGLLTGVTGGNNGTGTVTTSNSNASGNTAGTAGYINFTPASSDFYTSNTGTNSAITLSLGNIGGTTGVTQFAGTTYDQKAVTQNGVGAGAFSSVTTDANGNVIVNYDNGEQQTAYQIPVVTFAAADSLQRVNGQAFTATQASGPANTQYENTNAAGSLVTGSVEASNVDIATEFSALIIAQNAYSANAKVVTSADQLLQTTLQMKQ